MKAKPKEAPPTSPVTGAATNLEEPIGDLLGKQT